MARKLSSSAELCQMLGGWLCWLLEKAECGGLVVSVFLGGEFPDFSLNGGLKSLKPGWQVSVIRLSHSASAVVAKWFV